MVILIRCTQVLPPRVVADECNMFPHFQFRVSARDKASVIVGLVWCHEFATIEVTTNFETKEWPPTKMQPIESKHRSSHANSQRWYRDWRVNECKLECIDLVIPV